MLTVVLKSGIPERFTLVVCVGALAQRVSDGRKGGGGDDDRYDGQ